MVIDIEKLRLLILENPKSVHRPRDIARLVDKSPQTISREFERVEGTPLAEYIRCQKVEIMKNLLRSSDQLCKNICYEVGYRMDVGARIFKKTTGLTMEEFRRANGNGASELVSVHKKRTL